MRYALNQNNERIEVTRSKERAFCPSCKKEVVGKIYTEKRNHWAHLRKDCDSWYEPISEWHLRWQNIFPKKNQEITIYDEKSNEFHRADIRLNNGVIIEIQNSPLSIKDVQSREEFYGKNGLIWILNAQNLIPKTSFYNHIKTGSYLIKLIFDSFYYSDIEHEEIIQWLKDKRNIKFEKIKKSNHTITYIYKENNPFWDTKSEYNSIKYDVQSYHWKYLRANYKSIDRIFSIEIQELFDNISLDKNLVRIQWRKFIDKMHFPVFLDNVTELDSDFLFWVQKNKIVRKIDFTNKYLKYT